jgi:hypothetical protein
LSERIDVVGRHVCDDVDLRRHRVVLLSEWLHAVWIGTSYDLHHDVNLRRHHVVLLPERMVTLRIDVLHVIELRRVRIVLMPERWHLVGVNVHGDHDVDLRRHRRVLVS